MCLAKFSEQQQRGNFGRSSLMFVSLPLLLLCLWRWIRSLPKSRPVLRVQLPLSHVSFHSHSFSLSYKRRHTSLCVTIACCPGCKMSRDDKQRGQFTTLNNELRKQKLLTAARTQQCLFRRVSPIRTFKVILNIGCFHSLFLSTKLKMTDNNVMTVQESFGALT